MYHIGDDVRKKKSADLIAEAQRKLMREGREEKLNIAMVCSRAGVSRATFYRLFDSLDDVNRYLCDEELDKIFQCYLQERKAGHNVSPVEIYGRFIQQDEDGICAVMHYKKTMLLVQSHIRVMKKYAPVFFPQMEPGSDELTYFIDMRSWMLVGALSAWLETGRRAGSEELKRYISEQLKFQYRGPGT